MMLRRWAPFDIRLSSAAFRMQRAMNAATVSPGLCGSCVHARTLCSSKGSSFWLCGRHSTDPGFPKYPRLPVLQCRGHEPRQV
jgi:hypothetical protein